MQTCGITHILYQQSQNYLIICISFQLSLKCFKVDSWVILCAWAPSLCEPCFVARAYYGDINFFGGPSATSVKASAKLKQLEEENEDAMFVIVSDVWLDNIEVMEKLNLMFSGVFLHLLRL